MAAPKQSLLKVLNGRHAGAELLLSEGRNTIGSDDACDIVLADPDLAREHAVLSVAAGSVTVESANGMTVFVDGQPTIKMALRPYQVVTAGSTHLGIGPADAPWPALSLPTIASAPVDEPPPAEPEPESAAEKETVVETKTPSTTPSRRRGIVAVVVAALALLLFLVLWNPFSSAPAAATPDVRAELIKQVEGILAKFQSGSDLKIDHKATPVTVTGYVPTADVRKELSTALAATPGVRSTVSDTAGLAEAAGRVLKMHKVDLSTAPGGPGEVIVSGVTTDMAGWKKAKARLAADVPRIRTLTDRVIPPGQRSVPPPPKPGVESSPPVAVVEVKPAEAPMPIVAAEATPAAAPPAPATVDGVTMAIRSVTVGQSRSLVLVSGERLFEGAVLPSGHTLKSIASDRIVLEKMGEETVIPLKGGT